MSGSASLCCDVTQHASAPVKLSVLICMLTHVMSAPNVYTPCACHAAEQARICGYIFTLTSSSKWSLPNLCFPYLCQTLQAAFEKVKQEPPTEPGEGAGLYSCEHHQLSAIQVSLLLKGMLCVTLFFLLRLAPAPRPLTQSSPCWLCPLILLLATSRPVPSVLSSSQRHGPVLLQSFAFTKVITAIPQPVPSSLRRPTPPNFLDVPAVALILHDQIGDAIGADDNARTHLSIVWDLGVWLCASIVITCALNSGASNSCLLPSASARQVLAEGHIAQQAHAATYWAQAFDA